MDRNDESTSRCQCRNCYRFIFSGPSCFFILIVLLLYAFSRSRRFNHCLCLFKRQTQAYEAALDLGAKPRYALYKVVLPEIIPGILSGFMISFTLSLDDFVITQYLKKPSFETISTYIQKMIAKHPIPAEVRALTTIIFLVVLVVVVGNTVYNNRRAKMTIKRR